jgi:hypothetical protein
MGFDLNRKNPRAARPATIRASRKIAPRACLLGAAWAAALFLIPEGARADDANRALWRTRAGPLADRLPPPGDCATEMAMWAGFGDGMDAMSRTIETAFAALSPHAGLLARVDGTLRPLLLMPLSVPVGPRGATSTHFGPNHCFQRDESMRPFRVSVEPGLVLRKYSTGFVRASFRSIWHPANSVFGVGAGFGAIVDWQNSRALGFSPELLLQFGACCEPPFWQLSVRRDQYPSDREREAIVFVFGPTVW